MGRMEKYSVGVYQFFTNFLLLFYDMPLGINHTVSGFRIFVSTQSPRRKARRPPMAPPLLTEGRQVGTL